MFPSNENHANNNSVFILKQWILEHAYKHNYQNIINAVFTENGALKLGALPTNYLFWKGCMSSPNPNSKKVMCCVHPFILLVVACRILKKDLDDLMAEASYWAEKKLDLDMLDLMSSLFQELMASRSLEGQISCRTYLTIISRLRLLLLLKRISNKDPPKDVLMCLDRVFPALTNGSRADFRKEYGLQVGKSSSLLENIAKVTRGFLLPLLQNREKKEYYLRNFFEEDMLNFATSLHRHLCCVIAVFEPRQPPTAIEKIQKGEVMELQYWDDPSFQLLIRHLQEIPTEESLLEFLQQLEADNCPAASLSSLLRQEDDALPSPSHQEEDEMTFVSATPQSPGRSSDVSRSVLHQPSRNPFPVIRRKRKVSLSPSQSSLEEVRNEIIVYTEDGSVPLSSWLKTVPQAMVVVPHLELPPGPLDDSSSLASVSALPPSCTELEDQMQLEVVGGESEEAMNSSSSPLVSVYRSLYENDSSPNQNEELELSPERDKKCESPQRSNSSPSYSPKRLRSNSPVSTEDSLESLQLSRSRKRRKPMSRDSSLTKSDRELRKRSDKNIRPGPLTRAKRHDASLQLEENGKSAKDKGPTLDRNALSPPPVTLRLSSDSSAEEQDQLPGDQNSLTEGTKSVASHPKFPLRMTTRKSSKRSQTLQTKGSESPTSKKAASKEPVEEDTSNKEDRPREIRLSLRSASTDTRLTGRSLRKNASPSPASNSQRKKSKPSPKSSSTSGNSILKKIKK